MLTQTRHDLLLLLALDALDANTGPTGARRMAEIFTRAGYGTAEATAGRFLHRMDEEGLTRSLGKKGRVLTDVGRSRLKEMRWQAQIFSETAKVAKAVDTVHKKELLGLLYARRAVESETARLAAMHASDNELQEIRGTASNCQCISQHDRNLHAQNFHLLVIRASHNPLLIAVGSLLLNPQVEPAAKMLLNDLSQQQGPGEDLSDDHKVIADAIVQRNAPRAEKLMRDHIDALIAMVSR